MVPNPLGGDYNVHRIIAEQYADNDPACSTLESLIIRNLTFWNYFEIMRELKIPVRTYEGPPTDTWGHQEACRGP